MRKKRLLMPIGFLVVTVAFSAIVMLLWNWLMPAIFGLTAISFWQALGLFALARILFGRFGFGSKAMMHRYMHGMDGNPIHERWMGMTPEQRREFINKRRQFGFGHPFGWDRFDREKQDEQGDGDK